MSSDMRSVPDLKRTTKPVSTSHDQSFSDGLIVKHAVKCQSWKVNGLKLRIKQQFHEGATNSRCKLITMADTARRYAEVVMIWMIAEDWTSVEVVVLHVSLPIVYQLKNHTSSSSSIFRRSYCQYTRYHSFKIGQNSENTKVAEMVW